MDLCKFQSRMATVIEYSKNVIKNKPLTVVRPELSLGDLLI